jgi:hypothetical protein
MSAVLVTLDTNTLDHDKIVRMRRAASGLPIEFANTSVSNREKEGTDVPSLPEPWLPETAVWGESRWGEMAWGREEDDALFTQILRVLSNGSFPFGTLASLDDATGLKAGERRQLRDAMILLTHLREGRTILVSCDVKAFVGKDGARRRQLEALCSTKIMTVDEFCASCDALRQEGERCCFGLPDEGSGGYLAMEREEG